MQRAAGHCRIFPDFRRLRRAGVKKCGVLCAAFFRRHGAFGFHGHVFIFQGAIVLLANFIAPILTDAAIAEMICAGSVMIIGLGLNLLDITKLKIANMLPAIAIAPILCYIISII